MTHTLHRRGSVEDLHEDYVLLFLRARGVNFEGSEEKMRQMWEVISHYESKLSNFGSLGKGNSHRITMDVLKKSASKISHAVFTDRDTLKECLKELKDRNLGISVVVSGLYEEVKQICEEIGLSPHTVEHSLGIHGQTERLPDENILEITTMCGHAMASPNLVMDLASKIEEGKISCKEAAKELSRMCDCGVFNPCRAEKLLRRMTSKSKNPSLQ